LDSDSDSEALPLADSDLLSDLEALTDSDWLSEALPDLDSDPEADLEALLDSEAEPLLDSDAE